MNIGITCYPSVGGSGILASALGEELAQRGHNVHFIGYERPFRLPIDAPRISFHPVVINDYELFKYPDYTLPLSVKMAEVSRDHALDVLHVHYAVPHATAAILARSMLPAGRAPRIVTTLHGTDTTLLGHDPGYGPAIAYALAHSDAVTAVSGFLERETRRLLPLDRPVGVIHNFFAPRPPQRSRRAFRLLVLAGGDFAPYAALADRLGLGGRLIVREQVSAIEDYVQAADLALVTSESESFCLSILEAMCFGCPSVAMEVGGIPEVVETGRSGLLVPFGDLDAMVAAVESLLDDPGRRDALGEAARHRAADRFSAGVIVPQYEALYRRVCAAK
jgi:glycosyltransferase involved in cell wall biosynthesis